LIFRSYIFQKREEKFRFLCIEEEIKEKILGSQHNTGEGKGEKGGELSKGKAKERESRRVEKKKKEKEGCPSRSGQEKLSLHLNREKRERDFQPDGKT